MKEKEFKVLLEQIENNTFIGNKLEIDGSGWEEDSKVPEALTDDNIIALVEAIKKNSNITILELPFNNIGDKGAEALATLKLEVLNLYGNNITVKGATLLAKANFKNLDLSQNLILYTCFNGKIDPESLSLASMSEVQEMTQAFINNRTIISLSLNSCLIEEYNEPIAQLIGHNSSIQILNLGFNNLTDDVLKYLSNNSTLEELIIHQNRDITDLGVKYACMCSSLKKINFGSNQNITRNSIETIVTHPSLEKITLNSYSINTSELSLAFDDAKNLAGENNVNIEDF